MAKPTLTLYYDIVSPFGYMAYHVLRNSPTFASCDVRFVPVFLGGIMKACNNRPPIQIKNKDKWIELDRKRWAARFAIPISPSAPDGFPVLTLTTMRALAALSLADDPDLLVRATDALYHAFWVQRNAAGVDKLDGLRRVLADAIGDEAAGRALDGAAQDAAKKALSRNTDEAVAEGAFGAPFFVAVDARGSKEAYWGFDHLGMVVDFLGLQRSGGEWRAML